MLATNLPSRWDLHPMVRQALQVAVEKKIIDAADAVVMGATHGSDCSAIMEELTSASYAQRHGKDGARNHAAMCELNDSFRAAVAQ